MKSQPTDMTARVWQRVQEGSPSLQERQTMQKLIRQLQSDEFFLRKYAQQIPPGQSAVKKLAEEYAGQVAALRGLHAFSTGHSLGMLPQGALTHNLKQCYENALKRLKEYLLRSADPQYAPVYTQLARQTKVHCLMLAQAMGMDGDAKSKKRQPR